MSTSLAAHHRVLGVASSIAITFLAAGAVYGYEALRPVLLCEGAFASSCSAALPAPCPAQRLRLSAVFTSAMASLFGCATSDINQYLAYHTLVYDLYFSRLLCVTFSS